MVLLGGPGSGGVCRVPGSYASMYQDGSRTVHGRASQHRSSYACLRGTYFLALRFSAYLLPTTTVPLLLFFPTRVLDLATNIGDYTHQQRRIATLWLTLCGGSNPPQAATVRPFYDGFIPTSIPCKPPDRGLVSTLHRFGVAHGRAPGPSLGGWKGDRGGGNCEIGGSGPV